MKLTDDLHSFPVRLWVHHTPWGEDDLCLVFADADAFRGWFEQVLSEARFQRLV